MPLDHTTYLLEDELDRLADELADAAEREAAFDEEDQGSREYARVVQEGLSLESQRNGVQWLIDEFGEDAEVTVGCLNGGEHAWVEDSSSPSTGQQSTDYARRNHMAAAGLVDAPFMDGDEGRGERLTIVANDLPAMAVEWLADRVDDATVMETPGNSFEELVEEARENRNSTTSPTNSET